MLVHESMQLKAQVSVFHAKHGEHGTICQIVGFYSGTHSIGACVAVIVIIIIIIITIIIIIIITNININIQYTTSKTTSSW